MFTGHAVFVDAAAATAATSRVATCAAAVAATAAGLCEAAGHGHIEATTATAIRGFPATKTEHHIISNETFPGRKAREMQLFSLAPRSASALQLTEWRTATMDYLHGARLTVDIRVRCVPNGFHAIVDFQRSGTTSTCHKAVAIIIA